MMSPKAPKDKIFEKVINPYLTGVLQHPQSIEMHEGMLHIRDVEGPKKTGSMETRLEAMEQQVFKCQGMVERGLNANHMMIMDFTSKHRIDAKDIGKHLSRLYDRIDHLQAQIYDLQNQNRAMSLIHVFSVGACCTVRFFRLECFKMAGKCWARVGVSHQDECQKDVVAPSPTVIVVAAAKRVCSPSHNAPLSPPMVGPGVATQSQPPQATALKH
ncbi:40S ribosomal protein S5-1 [Hordeum vulgare]|nr:40S ribosomal protein S5-1 [Hordeum vulgare]